MNRKSIIVSEKFIDPALLLLCLCLIISGCQSRDENLKLSSIKMEITTLDTEIIRAEMEDEKYAGGLVKALIGSRIEILKQTREMLQQRDKAWTFGIKLRYTINGKPFVLSDSAKQLLPDVERELSELKSKIDKQELIVAQYSGGLVQALSIATLETMRQTYAMLDQRRLAIKYELPQYLGFQNKTEN